MKFKPRLLIINMSHTKKKKKTTKNVLKEKSLQNRRNEIRAGLWRESTGRRENYLFFAGEYTYCVRRNHVLSFSDFVEDRSVFCFFLRGMFRWKEIKRKNKSKLILTERHFLFYFFCFDLGYQLLHRRLAL